MYEYLLSVVIIVLTFIFIFKNKSPQKTMEHMVGLLATKFIKKMLEEVRQKIITGGYELMQFDLYKKEFKFSELISFHITLKNLLFSGASKFVTNNVSYDVTTSKALFDISIPKLFFAIGDSSATVSANFLGMDLEAQVKGWVTLMELRFTGELVLEIDEEGKVIVTNTDIKVELKKIQSKIYFSAMETDHSEAVNNFLQAQLPNLINTYVNSCKIPIEMGLQSIFTSMFADF